MNRSRSAFTLLEMLLVVVLILILMALAVPTMEGVYGDLRGRAAADALRAAWSDARVRAVNEGRPYRFSLIEGQGNYRVAPDSADYWRGGDAPSASDSAVPPLVLDAALPKGARFRSLETLAVPLESSSEASGSNGGIDPAAWTLTILFLPDGTVRSELEQIHIGIRAPSSAPLVVHMRTLTGVVSVRPYRPNGVRP